MEHFRPVRGLGLTASVLVGLAALGDTAEAAADWLTYDTVRDHRAGTATRADLEAPAAVRAATDLPVTLLTLAAVVVFVFWTYRARVNAERLTAAGDHRLTRVRAVPGWFVPVVDRLPADVVAGQRLPLPPRERPAHHGLVPDSRRADHDVHGRRDRRRRPGRTGRAPDLRVPAHPAQSTSD
ncbi:DUF4328 domain-containing protein [Lentzea sp. NPDC060358]|uniref:DUF4328 domain-containing protein n=1 Tax=Lentzea sp. NPDC060358 TaxID=3347103 RepID=UPI00364C07A2